MNYALSSDPARVAPVPSSEEIRRDGDTLPTEAPTKNQEPSGTVEPAVKKDASTRKGKEKHQASVKKNGGQNGCFVKRLSLCLNTNFRNATA